MLDRFLLVTRPGLKGQWIDPRAESFHTATLHLQKVNDQIGNDAAMTLKLESVKQFARTLRDEVALYSGYGQLPARNVANIGFVLYSEHILAVELAGTLLLVATIGAVAIAGRRKEATP